MKSRLFSLLVGVLVGAVAVGASAQSLERPKGKVVLTISGNVGEKNHASGAQFDMAMLEKLPQRTFTTMTPWDSKPIRFDGPLLRDVLAAAKAKGSSIQAVALNDYQTRIPMDDMTRFDVVLAHKMNGESIPVKTKGPLFIVYPYDSKPELRSSTYYERSAWQLKSMTVE